MATGWEAAVKTKETSMKQYLSLLLAIGLSLSAIQGTSGQTPQGQDEVIRVRTNEVRLDVVVKDKKGRPVKDLSAGDFEVLKMA